MTLNVGQIDRIARFILGALLILAPLASGAALFADPIYYFGALIVGAVLVLTAALRFCPLYRVLGICT